MLNKHRILIISPHTDDAELGAGATIAFLLDQGAAIKWVVFSSARESVPEGMPINTLYDECVSVMDLLKIQKKDYCIHEYNVRRLHEKRQEILEDLVRARNEYAPDLVIGPSLNDLHQDHQIVANEMVRAFKSHSSILGYELPWNNIKFENNYFFRFDERHLERKIQILGQYKSQVNKGRQYFNPEFIRGLAIARGTQVNAAYAEAFEVIRWIV